VSDEELYQLAARRLDTAERVVVLAAMLLAASESTDRGLRAELRAALSLHDDARSRYRDALCRAVRGDLGLAESEAA
jgi:hypothetical protein